MLRTCIHIVLLLWCLSAYSQDTLLCANYRGFIKQDAAVWDSVINQYDEINPVKGELLKNFITALYGYVGLLYVQEQKSKAKQYNDRLEQKLNLYESSSNDFAFINAMRGSCYGFKVMLNSPFSSMYNFAKCLNLVESAVKNDSLSPYGWIETGNVRFQMVTFLGGSYAKVAANYKTAITIFESSGEDLSCNWYYLNSLLFYAKCFEEQKMHAEAIKVYKKILALAPGFDGASRWMHKQESLLKDQ